MVFYPGAERRDLGSGKVCDPKYGVGIAQGDDADVEGSPVDFQRVGFGGGVRQEGDPRGLEAGPTHVHAHLAVVF